MSHTVETNINTSIRWDPSYALKLPGVFKLSQAALNLIGLFCVMFAGAYQATSAGEWFIFVTATGFLINLIILLLYCFHVIEKFHVIPWNLIEAVYDSFWAFFLLTASISVATFAHAVSAFGAAAFFGFAAMVFYVVDAVFRYQAFRGRIMPQFS